MKQKISTERFLQWHVGFQSRWRHQMETFSALLTICAGNSPVTGEFPAQRPVTRSFNVFFDLRLNKRLSKQSRGRWFETLSRPLWRHSNESIFNSLNPGDTSWMSDTKPLPNLIRINLKAVRVLETHSLWNMKILHLEISLAKCWSYCQGANTLRWVIKGRCNCVIKGIFYLQVKCINNDVILNVLQYNSGVTTALIFVNLCN